MKRRSPVKILKNVLFLFLVTSSGVLGLTLFKRVSIYGCTSILLASLFAILNFIVFILLSGFSSAKSNQIFLFWSLGGAFIRLFMILVLIFVSIKFLKVDLVAFIFTFFIWYVVLLIFEISMIHFGTVGSKSKIFGKHVL